MTRSLAYCVCAAALLFVGCSKNNDEGNNGRVTFDRDQGGGGGEDAGAQDMGAADTGVPVDMAEETDSSSEIDFTVQAEGVMHGRWTATRTDGGAEIVKLRLRHEAGESSIVGTFEMTNPAASGLIGGSNYTFTTSWSTRIDDIDRQFGLTACESSAEGVFECDHNDPLTGSVVAATLTKDP